MKKALLTLTAVLAIFGAGVSAQATILYGTSGNGGTISTLYTIDLATGVTAPIGSVGYAVNGLEYYGGTLYGTTSIKDPSFHGLLTIDTATGAGTPVGSGWGGSITALTLVEMAIDSSGNAYAWGEPSEDDLYSVNLSLGTGSRVGEAGLGTSALGLGFDSSDILHLMRFAGGGIYTINTATGASTLLSSPNFWAHHGDTSPDSGLFWGLNSYPGGSGGSTGINIVDLSTQSITGTLALDRAIHTLAFSAIPEPSTILLISTGLIGVVGLARRRRKNEKEQSWRRGNIPDMQPGSP